MVDVNKPQYPSIDEVVAAARAVGMSYGQFVAAGLPVPEGILKRPVRKKAARIDADLFDQLYQAGYTDFAISTQMGVSPTAITKYRKRQGLPASRRPR